MINFLKRLIKEKPLGSIGAIIIVILVFVGIFADSLAPYGMNETNLSNSLLNSSPQYLLGTDNLGRDVLSRIIYGSRISLVVGLGSTIIASIISILIGLISGFVGGKLDMAVQRVVDAFRCCLV